MHALKMFIVLMIMWQCISAQASEKFFRNDYKYLEETESFYKVHTIHRNWLEAKKMCAAEGAQLFYPQDIKEADVVAEFFKKSQPGFAWAFVGGSALLAKGVYETIDGVPVEDLYHKWGQGEPNSIVPGFCVVMKTDTTLDDIECGNLYPFICKKSLESLQWNEPCNTPFTDYVYHNDSGRCYKFHLNPKSWIDAYATCSAEQSYLTVINSQEEADYLVELIKNAPIDNIAGDYLRGTVHVGFHNKTNEDWMTLKGVPLVDSGYSQWGNGEPNGIETGEQCGSLFYGGGLNDISCSTKCFFICEHDVKRPSINMNFYLYETSANEIDRY